MPKLTRKGQWGWRAWLRETRRKTIKILCSVGNCLYGALSSGGVIPRSCNRQTAVPPFASFPFRLGVFQCCEDSCISGFHDCGDNGYHCLDPAFYDPELVAQYPDCTGRWSTIGDSWCDESNNNAACGYDGGDCCLCSCSAAACIWTFFDCKDSTADDELYECKEMPSPALPCSAEVQQA